LRTGAQPAPTHIAMSLRHRPAPDSPWPGRLPSLDDGVRAWTTGRGNAYCIAVWLGAAVLVWLLALWGPTLLEANRGQGVPGWPPPRPHATPAALGSALERWDALWYLRIATDGYRAADGSAAFFPLYPVLVRAVAPVLGGHPLAAALLLSHGATLGALMLMYRAVAEDHGESAARRAVLYLALFPTSFFLYAPYPESLLLLTSVASMWLARRRRWAGAGATAALASATKAAGLVLVLPLAVEALRALRTSPRGRHRLAAVIPPLATLAAPLGTAVYLLYWHLQFTDAWAPLTQQALWLRTPSWPWDTLVDATVAAWRSVGAFPGGYHMIDWLIVCPMLMLALWTTPRLPLAQRLYVWGALVPSLLFVFPGRPLMSLPRFLLALWPLFAGLAVLVVRPGPRAALAGISCAGLAVLTVLYVNWYWIF
jgi:hypothetical protein